MRWPGRMRMGVSSVTPPSPLPSPLGRGRISRRAFANPERLDSSQRGMRCSLYLREREKTMRGLLPCLCRLSYGLLSGHEHKFDDVRGKGFFAQTRRERRAYPTVDL